LQTNILKSAGEGCFSWQLLKKVISTLIPLSALLLVGCASSGHRSRQEYVNSEIEKRIGRASVPASALHWAREDARPPTAEAEVPDGIDLEDGVSQDEAIALALWNNGAFHQALAQLGLSRADVIQAGLFTNPTFSILFPWGPKQLEFAATFPLEAIWLRPRRLAVAKVEDQRIGESLVQHGLDLVRDVKVNYSDLLLARDRERLGQEAVQLRRRIADIAEARLQAGDVSELEISSARVDAVLAREEGQRLEKDTAIAGARLRSLLGMDAHEPKFEFKAANDLPAFKTDRAILVKEAYAARPDLRRSLAGSLNIAAVPIACRLRKTDRSVGQERAAFEGEQSRERR
jgi:cobalt-zinc-cadmium efflux system outer membrane protein